MAQTSTFTITNQSGALVRGRLNEALAALQSANSGTAPPPETRGGMFWVDTSTSPATLRIRNLADDDWIALGTLDATFAVAGLVRATQSQALAGTNDAALMTPLRVREHFNGRLASKAEAEAGSDNTRFLSPLRGRQMLDALAGGRKTLLEWTHLSDVSEVVFTGLGASHTIRITGRLVSTDRLRWLRLSADGGQSFFATPGQYDSVVTSPNNNNDAQASAFIFERAGTENTRDSVITINRFNEPAQKTAWGLWSDTRVGTHLGVTMGPAMAVAMDALKIMTATGAPILAGSHLTLEGFA